MGPIPPTSRSNSAQAVLQARAASKSKTSGSKLAAANAGNGKVEGGKGEGNDVVSNR